MGIEDYHNLLSFADEEENDPRDVAPPPTEEYAPTCPSFRQDVDFVELRHYGEVSVSEKGIQLKMHRLGAGVWWPKSQLLSLDSDTVTVTRWIYDQKGGRRGLGIVE